MSPSFWRGASGPFRALAHVLPTTTTRHVRPGTTPGRVYRGLRMAGHMGDETITVKKVRVVRTDTDRNLLLVKGSLPGARGGLILVKKA